MAMPDDHRAGNSFPTRVGAARMRGVTPSLAFGLSVVSAFAAAGVARHALPGQLVLPFAASLVLALAAAVALAGWRSRRRPKADDLTYWDVAGALTFVGVGLSALIEPEHLMPLMEGMPNQTAQKQQ